MAIKRIVDLIPVCRKAPWKRKRRLFKKLGAQCGAVRNKLSEVVEIPGRQIPDLARGKTKLNSSVSPRL
jgi:hypothetical protein